MVFAVTQHIDGGALTLALDAELRRRKMEPFDRFTVPAQWGPGYIKLSKPVPHCDGYSTVELASRLAARLIDPALTGEASDKTWSPETLSWD
ncbi:hypothetical protein [Rothia halotolerans]|uniref:hypothetical protein n=1 Tax=Rothia halotolerans TaxID=405770 RepID=UPI00101C8AEC|nr:hypothetical protein [Rothia halotolerans]